MESSGKLRSETIHTLNDLMNELQREILDVKGGIITDQTARVVLGCRKAQLKTAELGLQYLRIMKPKTPTMDGGDGVPLLPIPQKDSVSETKATSTS